MESLDEYERRFRRAGLPLLTVGVPELVGFVILPAALPLVFGGQVTSAVVTALANAALLALVETFVARTQYLELRGAIERRLGVLMSAVSP